MTPPPPFYEDEAVILYHGDSREVLPRLSIEPAAVVTDPPYAISVAGSVYEKVAGKGSRHFDFFKGDDDWVATTAMVLDVLDLATPESVRSAYVWCGHRQFGPIVEWFEASGWSTRFLVWNKSSPAPAPQGSGYMSAAELCVFAWRDGRTWNHRTGPSNVITAHAYHHGQPGKLAHPTQKRPVLIGPLIEASTSPGDLVLDPFAGSGTTLRLAKDLGRRAVGIECDRAYCEVIADRLAQSSLVFE